MKYGIIELKNSTNPQPILMIRDRNSDGSSLELFFIKSIIKRKVKILPRAVGLTVVVAVAVVVVVVVVVVEVVVVVVVVVVVEVVS
jgi:hypothetical protein